MTGYGVSGSNSVEFAPSMPTTWRAKSATAICMPRQMPRNGIRCSRAIRAAVDLALDPAHAEAAGDQDAVGLREARRGPRASSSVSESTQSISIPQPCWKPAWRSASTTDR